MSRNIFIVGTGTDVGKTFVAGLIVKKLYTSGRKAAYYKAAMSGNVRGTDGRMIPQDALCVKQMSGISQGTSDMCPYVYENAVSPHLASRIEGNPVRMDVVKQCFQKVCSEYEYVTVEGSGELTNTMLRKAIATLSPNEKPIVHSDRGCHYRWPEWIKIMDDAGLTRSMSKKGCSPDNSACEGFFGHLKTEMFYGHNWDDYSIDEFIQEVNDYMQWYCRDRIKTTLGGLSPLDYRRSIGVCV